MTIDNTKIYSELYKEYLNYLPTNFLNKVLIEFNNIYDDKINIREENIYRIYIQIKIINMLFNKVEININNIFELFTFSYFEENIKNSDIKKYIIASLRFGYFDKKYYSVFKIANFFNVEVHDIESILNEIILDYQYKLDDILKQSLFEFNKKEKLKTIKLQKNNS